MIRDTIGYLSLVARSVAGVKLNALDMLKIDHLRARTLFLQLRLARNSAQRAQTYTRLSQLLKTHMRIEEEVFYPACEKVVSLKDLALEAREEHEQVKLLVEDLDGLSIDNESWKPKFTVLFETIEHHVRSEENEMFPKVSRHFDSEKLLELGGELERARGRQGTSKKKAA